MRTRLAFVLIAAVALLAAPQAFFHFELLRSAPSAKAELTASPAQLQLWFSQVPAAGVSTVTLSNNGKHVAIGKTVVAAADKSMTVALTTPLTPGAYVIHWKGAGDDGHVQQGDIAFTIAAK